MNYHELPANYHELIAAIKERLMKNLWLIDGNYMLKDLSMIKFLHELS